MCTHRVSFRSIGGLVLAGALTCAASAQFVMDPAVNYSVSHERPNGIAALDLNNNGFLDLAVVTDHNVPNNDRVEFFINQGDGTFVSGGWFLLAGTSGASELIAADFSGNGHPDLAVVIRNQNRIQILLNNGSGSGPGAFSLGSSTIVGENARGMSAGDFDGDGHIDLVIANRDHNTASVLKNNGDATFAATTLAVGDEPRAATFGDFNGSGMLDIAVTNNRDRTISIFLNNGKAFVASGLLSVGSQRRPERIVAADLNGNGLDDLAVASNGTNFESASVFLATGGGAFAGVVHYNTGGLNTSGIMVADLDCDGLPDLITRNSDSNNISLLRNLGSGTFGPPMTIAVGTRPDEFIAVDLDGDGGPDIAVTNRDSDNFSIIINHTCEPGGPTPAELIDFAVVHGTLIDGGLDELRESDGMHLAANSAFGFSATQPNLLRIRVDAQSGVAGPSTVDVSVESRLNQAGGTAQIGLRNWSTVAIDPLLTEPIGTEQIVLGASGLDASQYVRGDGLVEVDTRYWVVATFAATGFQGFVDHVLVEVE